MSAVRLEGVAKSFGRVRAVDGVSLAIDPGELVAVLGPSGCGKTTLLRLIAGFERPDAGRVGVGGAEMAGPGGFVPPERRAVGMVFQDYALFPHLTVTANVAFGLARRERAEREALTKRTLELVGLQHKADRYPHELSGGERQRVALARASRSRTSTPPCAPTSAARSSSSCATPRRPRCSSRTTRRRRYRSPTGWRSCARAGSCRSGRPRRSTRGPPAAGWRSSWAR